MSFKTFSLKGFGKKLFFAIAYYAKDESPAYEMLCLDDGYEDDFATLSVCLDAPPRDGVWIKNYGENEELVRALENEGLLERTGQIARTGYATVPSMIFTVKAQAYIKK